MYGTTSSEATSIRAAETAASAAPCSGTGKRTKPSSARSYQPRGVLVRGVAEQQHEGSTLAGARGRCAARPRNRWPDVERVVHVFARAEKRRRKNKAQKPTKMQRADNLQTGTARSQKMRVAARCDPSADTGTDARPWRTPEQPPEHEHPCRAVPEAAEEHRDERGCAASSSLPPRLPPSGM